MSAHSLWILPCMAAILFAFSSCSLSYCDDPICIAQREFKECAFKARTGGTDLERDVNLCQNIFKEQVEILRSVKNVP